MTKILGALDFVPSWAYAAAVVALASLVLVTELGRQRALTQASLARADLLAVQLSSAQAISLEQERARKEERRLSAAVLEVQDVLAKEKADRAGRVADLSERLRKLSRPVLCRPGGGGAPAAASRSDGQPDPGLPGVAGAGVVVLDGQALSELADFAESAADTGRTLIKARRLLRECWRSEPAPATP